MGKGRRRHSDSRHLRLCSGSFRSFREQSLDTLLRSLNGIDVPTCSIRAQAELGDIVYVELPDVGSEVKQGEQFGVIESVKVELCSA